MPDLTSAKLKEFAGKVGVDVLGVAPIERFEGAPPGRHPADLYPDAKSVITIGFRITRGSLRGIEEGTDWAAYDFMSYGGIVVMYSVIAQREISRFIEDHGYEAVPFIHTCLKQAGQPVAPGRPKPDVLLNERILAVAAGLGEIGYSRMFLSPRFGPAIRVFPILTNAALRPDPMVRTRVCDGCKRCVKECPAQAISASETESVTIEGQTYEMARMDMERCAWCHHGGMRAVSPFISRDVRVKGKGVLYSKELMDIPYCRSQNRFLRHVAICGAAGCVRACMIHLEERGRISQSFKTPFRVRSPWWPLSPVKDRSRPAKRSSSSQKPKRRTKVQGQSR
jgi:ferredoxin